MADSIRKRTMAVRAVFRCVASRNSAARHTKAGVFSAKTFSPEWPIRHLTGAVVVPSGTPGLPRRGVQQGIRSVVARRQRWVLLVVVGSFREWQCPLLKFHHRRARSAVPHHPCGRLSVALPPGRESSTGPGVPLGTRTAPTGCFAGLFSTKRDTNGCGWSSTASGSNARYWHFNYNFLARQASKTPGERVALPQGTGG